MLLSKKNEEALIEVVKNLLKDDEWTYKHTLAVAEAMKEIIAHEGGDEKVLVTAAYLHDIGYSGKLNSGYSLKERIEAKANHMECGAEMAKEILEKLDYSRKEINEITHLISVHDKLADLKTENEIKVMEADTIGQIAPGVGNSFGEEEFAKYVKIFEEKRFPRVKTKTGKELVKKHAHAHKMFQKYTTKLKKER